MVDDLLLPFLDSGGLLEQPDDGLVQAQLLLAAFSLTAFATSGGRFLTVTAFTGTS